MTEPASICELLDDLAADLGEIERRVEGTVEEYLRSNTVFAACDASTGTADFRLRTEIAAAALRTPETAESDRGPEWISLRPAMLDQFTHDRAQAWFETGWRIAGE